MKRKKTILFLACLMTLTLVYKGNKGTFSADDLLSPSESGSAWDTSSLDHSFPIDTILSQKFHFLGKGHQAFAFASADGQYVLKLFKPHYPHITLLGQSINFTPIPFSRWLYRTLYPETFHQGVEQDLASYINARIKFQPESLVEYLHLAKTSHLNTTLQIFDKKGSLKTLPADTTCFLIQRKVIPLQIVLDNLTQENRKEDAKLVLKRLVTLLERRVELGFYKPTHKFHVNFGCVDLQPIQLDIGRLFSIENAEIDKKAELQISIQKLQEWVAERCPNLLDCLPREQE